MVNKHKILPPKQMDSTGGANRSGHIFHPSVLREYDIRGIVGQTLFEQDAEYLGRGFGSFIKRQGGSCVAVARDGRLSSPLFTKALIRGIISTGLSVKDIGVGPTPMLYYAVFELDTDGGIMVTGSHNPPDYNGFKMMAGKKPCYGQAIQDLGAITERGDFETGTGFSERVDIFDRYIDRLAKDFTGKAHKIAWDPANGSAGDAISALVKKLPGEHIVINAEIDGTFPNHHADPTVEKNLEQLKDIVKREKCDLGIGFDGDGDRIGAVDAKGRVVWGDQLLAIMAAEVLADQPGATIIADVKASDSFYEKIAQMGGNPVMWKTGHSLIKAKMAEMKAPLAGEMSGHIFYKHKFYGHDDALYAALRLINSMDMQGKSLAELKDELPVMMNTPELRFDCPDNRKFAIIDKVELNLKKSGADMITVDGVRVKTNDGWWLLRASNTQAVLVARCESRTLKGLERLKKELVKSLMAVGITPPADL